MRIGLQTKFQLHNGTFPAIDMTVLQAIFGYEAVIGDGKLNAISRDEKNMEVMYIC
ncbi:MAG: hypothetical protein LUI02_03200 [Clostridiales bacterium]|nr:hypothetical protein [Clostridiales bacterium]